MAQITAIGRRTSSGSTAADGWLNFYFDDPIYLGSQYKVTSVYARFTKIRSASGKFTGDVPVRVDTSGGKYDLGKIVDYTFPASTETNGTTVSGYLQTSQNVMNSLASVSIERIDLGDSDYLDDQGNRKDIRCLESSTAELVLDYEIRYFRCTAPNSVTVGATSTMNSTVSLAWSGASAGTDNPISGYKVEYADSYDNKSWGSWEYLETYTGSPKAVEMPDVGMYRKYRVWTLGAAGDDWGSATATESGSVLRLQTYTRCTAPVSAVLSTTSTMNGTVSLSWGGANGGTNNEISGYLVEYAESTDNASWGSWTYYNTYTSSPQTVDTPSVGKYRKYRVRTLGSAGSDWHSEKATETGSVLRLQTITRCVAPKTVTIANTITAATMNTLSWSGASGGTNNSISGYFIQYADSSNNSSWGAWGGDITVGVVSSASVPMPASGMYRKYRVFTLGTAGSNWRSGSATESGSTYRGHEALDGFTDSPLVVGKTYVKALHMRELQDRVNTLRSFYGLSKYSFSTITSRTTDLKHWTAHVNEIRKAIDEISTNHAAWIAIPVNCPRADVIEQLRAVILAM